MQQAGNFQPVFINADYMQLLRSENGHTYIRDTQ